MKLRFEQLEQHVKHSLQPIYLITGNVPLLMLEAKNLLREAAKQKGILQRISLQVERGFNWSELTQHCQMDSLFGDRFFIELNLGTSTLTETAKTALLSYATASTEHMLVVNSEKKITFTEFLPHCVFIQLWPIEAAQYPRFLQQRLQKAGLRTDSAGLQVLATHTEGNLLAAQQEIEKLVLLYPHSLITAEQMATSIANSARYTVFQLSDTLLQGQTSRSWHILNGLRQEGTEAILVLWSICQELRTLLAIHDKMAQRHPTTSIYNQLGIWEKRKPYYAQAIQRLSIMQVQKLLQQAAFIDRTIKGLEKDQPWLLLERLTMAFG